MKKAKGVLLIGILTFLMLWWAAGYYVWNNVLQLEYKDSYTLDEINTKVLSWQQKSVETLEKELEKQPDFSQKQRVSWDIKYSLEANSSFGWGNANVSIGNFDLQYEDKKVDISLQDLIAAWEAEIMGQKQGMNFAVKDVHYLANASGSYVKLDKITYELSDIFQKDFPEDVIVTLNKLWEGWKYINLAQNPMYSIIEAQIAAQGKTSSQTQNFILNFLKNENVFVAQKQEETKYHLTVSPALCKLKKSQKNNGENTWAENQIIDMQNPFLSQRNIKSGPESYEEFKNDYIECTQDEYNEMLTDFHSSDKHMLKDFYIELSPQKFHFVSNIELYFPKKSDDAYTLNAGYEWVFTLTDIEASRFYAHIDHEDFTWSWILIENTAETINGYVDIDLPKYNFDSNLSFSGMVDDYKVLWDYSYSFPEDPLDRRLAWLSWVKLTGSIDWDIGKNAWNIQIINSFSSSDEYGISGEITIDSDYTSDGIASSWNTNIAGKLSLGNQASPMSGDIKIIWENENSQASMKWKYDVNLSIPNIATGKYNLEYNMNFSENIDTDFTSPTDVISEKSFQALLQINARKVEKEREEELIEKIQELKKWNYTFTDNEKMNYNSSINTDIRKIASAIEVHISSGWSIEEILSNSLVMDIPEDNPFDYKNFNFYESNDLENQQLLEWNPNTSKLNIDISNLNPPLVRILKSDKAFICYQVWWETITFTNTFEKTIKWSCIHNNLENPADLFDIDMEKTQK